MEVDPTEAVAETSRSPSVASARSPSVASKRSPSVASKRSPSIASKRSPSPSLRCAAGVEPRVGRIPDALNSEFLYYSSVLKVIAPAISSECDRKRIIPWVRKLFRPEYHSMRFREKRNKYLLNLTISLLNDETYGIFKTMPPEGALAELENIEIEALPAAEWEMDKTWLETIQGLPDDFQPLDCSVHGTKDECDQDHNLDTILDQEFQYLMYLARPYASLINGRFERTKVATWLQTLCSIQGDFCSSMKAIRNDYMMALLGYIHDLRLSGPFAEYPPFRTLVPLVEAAKIASESKPITDPTSPDVTEFLSTQPVPDEGAFCYISITGDLVSSSLGPNMI